MFFVLVSLAAWSSAISLAEPIVAWMVERFNMGRNKAAVIIGVSAWTLGMATVFSFNIWSDVKLFDKTPFDLLDFLTTNILLPLGGLCIAIFASWKMSQTKMKNEVGIDYPVLYKLWLFTLRFLAPVAIVAVLINGLI